MEFQLQALQVKSRVENDTMSNKFGKANLNLRKPRELAALDAWRRTYGHDHVRDGP